MRPNVRTHSNVWRRFSGPAHATRHAQPPNNLCWHPRMHVHSYALPVTKEEHLLRLWTRTVFRTGRLLFTPSARHTPYFAIAQVHTCRILHCTQRARAWRVRRTRVTGGTTLLSRTPESRRRRAFHPPLLQQNAAVNSRQNRPRRHQVGTPWHGAAGQPHVGRNGTPIPADPQTRDPPHARKTLHHPTDTVPK